MLPPPELARALLAWYRDHRRALPWRSSVTPYRVLLSELMLQQTRVDTVIPYFERFVARWPDLEAFAAADEDEVLREWAGLGYYSRARNLHRAARLAVGMGGLPADVERLRALPGVGAYTAGAVASIAFGIREPAVDGNVERVLSRLDGRKQDPRSPVGRRALDARVRELLEDAPAGDLTQALMELGATVCTPRGASCPRCPWAGACVARAEGAVERLPIKRAKAPPRPMRAVAGLLRTERGVLLGKRPPGLLGGLWEPVGAELADEDPREAVRRAFRDRAGVLVRVGPCLGEIVHVFSHRRLVLTVYDVWGQGAARPLGYPDLRWVDPGAPDVALSTLARKTLALLPQLSLLAADAED